MTTEQNNYEKKVVNSELLYNIASETFLIILCVANPLALIMLSRSCKLLHERSHKLLKHCIDELWNDFRENPRWKWAVDDKDEWSRHGLRKCDGECRCIKPGGVVCYKYNDNITERYYLLTYMRYYYITSNNITDCDKLEEIFQFDKISMIDKHRFAQYAIGKLLGHTMMNDDILVMKYLIEYVKKYVYEIRFRHAHEYVYEILKQEIFKGPISPRVIKMIMNESFFDNYYHYEIVEMLIDMIENNKTYIMKIIGRAMTKQAAPDASKGEVLHLINRIGSAANVPGVNEKTKKCVDILIQKAPQLFNVSELFLYNDSIDDDVNNEEFELALYGF